MTQPLHVDFNRRDHNDHLVAAPRRVDVLPKLGQTVDVVDDEDNRALARVVLIDSRQIVLEPLWNTFAGAEESRMIPTGSPATFLEAWSTATTVTYGPSIGSGFARVEWVSGGPSTRRVPA